MKRIWLKRLGMLIIFAVTFGCGEKQEQESKVKKAVEEVVTKEFKMYEDAKRSLERIKKKSQERGDMERKLK